MFLEGEVNWILVLGVIAGAMTLLAAWSTWFALTHRETVVTRTGELDVVQKVAESADKRLFETLNAIPVAIVETDTQGKFVFANRAAHQLLGRRDAELIGLRFHSAPWGITFPDGRTIPPDMLPSARALRGQTVRGFQHILANPATRRKMLVSVTAMPIENEWGQIIGSTAAIVETEGLTTPEPQIPVVEAAANPADAIARQVFEAASSALVIVSLHGEVRLANPVALHLIGGTDPAGADFADLFVASAARIEARQSLRAALRVEAGDAEPLVATAVDGVAMRWNILPLAGPDGATESLLLAGDAVPVEIAAGAVETPVDPAVEQLVRERDTAQTRADEAMEQARVARIEAETALAEVDRVSEIVRAESDSGRRLESIGRISGGVARDFNALLGVMTSALDMILRQADDPSRVRRLGEAALAAGRRGEAVTQRLSAFTQEDDNEVRTLDAGILLRAMESRLRALAGPGVDLLIEGPSGPAPVRLDPVAFEGAVKALVVNAVEAVGAHGSVAVRLETADGGARLTVRDSGPGMDRDIVARASEPFFTTKQGAAGLGLAQAMAFARQSGGTLSIDSMPGEGAEVAVIFPALAA
ncbi:hypothetical protein BH10PSE1_BH10PSE1_30620 [soil metagenome]